MPCQRPIWGPVKHLNLGFRARVKGCLVNSVNLAVRVYVCALHELL